MEKLFGYVRVSTAKQGEQGVSLQEQRDAILRYAQRNGLEVTAWFEERQTAAKRGRLIFNRMLKLLKQGKADGVIIHKIDRSARNLKDWADLGELIDQGIEVYFANESLDLHSRGGRLSADIQAVVAADYIRNLREETRKGFYGRLKQGLYPLPAPLGYLDSGKGKPKIPDPARASLIRKTFQLYASGAYNLEKLAEEMYRLGLRNKKGKGVSRTGFSIILNNPFYIGLVRLRRTGEMFQGCHPPLIPKSLFDRVQAVLQGKTQISNRRHNFLFRRLLTCRHCGYSLIGETQKGHVYYRCHTSGCPNKCVREDRIEEEILDRLSVLRFTRQEKNFFKEKITQLKEDWGRQKDEEIKALNLRVAQLQERLARLTDAYIDRLIDQELFENRKAMLLQQKKDLEEKRAEFEDGGASLPEQLEEFLELAGSAYFQYKLGLPEEKRDLMKIVTSNRWVQGKNVDLMLATPFDEVAKRSGNSNGTPYWDRPRTLDSLIRKLIDYFKHNPGPEIRQVIE